MAQISEVRASLLKIEFRDPRQTSSKQSTPHTQKHTRQQPSKPPLFFQTPYSQNKEKKRES